MQGTGSFTDTFSKDYVLGVKTEVSRLVKRELKVTWRNKFGLQLRLFQVCSLTLCTSSISSSFLVSAKIPRPAVKCISCQLQKQKSVYACFGLVVICKTLMPCRCVQNV